MSPLILRLRDGGEIETEGFGIMARDMGHGTTLLGDAESRSGMDAE
ncbi:MAG: hypothetical protein ABSH56_22295 [Bryobacteraceae bacterium]|jgi:hypothetical protein